MDAEKTLSGLLLDRKEGLVVVTDRPAVGEIWKEGSIRWYIVATEDDGFIYVKRADNAKKVLARAAGGYPVAPSDYQNWVKVND